MKIDFGSRKKVFIFKHFVIKIPRTVHTIDAVYWEQINYIFSCKKVRKLLLPSYFIPFIPITIQRRVNVSKRVRDVRSFVKKIRKNRLSMRDYEVLHDIQPLNLGWYKGTLYKIDYDAEYRLYNLYCNIKSKIKNFYLK